jgi:hypothetical protein
MTIEKSMALSEKAPFLTNGAIMATANVILEISKKYLPISFNIPQKSPQVPLLYCLLVSLVETSVPL